MKNMLIWSASIELTILNIEQASFDNSKYFFFLQKL